MNQGEVDEEEETKKASAERAERISAKIHALVWVLVALTVVYFTDLPHLLFSDKINRYVTCWNESYGIAKLVDLLCFRWALNLAVTLFFTNVGIFLYLTVWLPYVLKVTAPWEVYCPNMIPTATGLGVVSMILTMIAFWPVWGMLSPLIVIVLVIGFIFSAHFIPWPF